MLQSNSRVIFRSPPTNSSRSILMFTQYERIRLSIQHLERTQTPTMPLVLISLLFTLLLLAELAECQLDFNFNVGKHHKLVECRHGTFLINEKDTWIGRSLDVYGDWSQLEIELIAHFINEGDIVADVGANIGSFTVPMAKMVGPSGRLVAFEPQRVLSHLLNANIALNELFNAGVFNAAVGDSDSPIEVPDVIYSDPANYGAIGLLDPWAARGVITSLVPQLQLDNVFGEQCPSFIKIDVEGMELRVLSGARQMLKSEQCNPVLYLENNCRKGSKEIIESLSSFGYQCYWHVNPYFSPYNYRQNKNNIFGHANSINMLCVSLHDQTSLQKASELLPTHTRVDTNSGRYLLEEYNLIFTDGEGTVLSQLGTMDSCNR